MPNPASVTSRLTSRNLRSVAVALLTLSLVVRGAIVLFAENGAYFVDLRVYIEGGRHLTDGSLYDFTFGQLTPDFPLPFTYPPFAAVVFWPLHLLPLWSATTLWILGSLAALYAIARVSQLLIHRSAPTLFDDRHRAISIAMAWTAVGPWCESIRSTLNYGQINLFLVLAGLGAALAVRDTVAGSLVGLAAGVKLTPAVTGLYLLAQRRWRAALISAGAFFATIGVSALLAGSETREYFTTLLGDDTRIGDARNATNQSLYGVVARSQGVQDPNRVVWAVLVVLAGAAAVAAWRGIGRRDLLATLLVVQFFGLLASPISWSHHWVWLLPMAIWLLHGPQHTRTAVRALFVATVLLAGVGLPWLLAFTEHTDALERGGWHALLFDVGALAFPLLALGFFAVLATGDRYDQPARIVVAGALVADGKLLVARRTSPPELAGRWELPGGKVEPGEAQVQALRRELREELGVEVRVGKRFVAHAELPTGARLEAYRVTLRRGTPHALAHGALRWVDRRELDALPLVEADRVWLPELRALLAG